MGEKKNVVFSCLITLRGTPGPGLRNVFIKKTQMAFFLRLRTFSVGAICPWGFSCHLPNGAVVAAAGHAHVWDRIGSHSTEWSKTVFSELLLSQFC